LMHDAEMRQFFLVSGYAVWFLYFVIAAETIGAIGLFISKLIIPAASGLAILMVGAIFTHYRNNDPFSDSLEAFHLLILLACILIIGLLRQKVSSGPVDQIDSVNSNI
jgi:putative oxidoreductase